MNPNVLIPRPETEMLVDEAIRIAKRYTFKNKISIADVGTGSGCIAISLIKTIPNSEVIATDINYKALTIASCNIQRYDIEHRVHLVQTSLLNGIENKFDLICANLPYIPTNKLMGLSDLKYEPFQALDGGSEGLDLINRLLEDIKNKIQPGGTIFLEIESTQKQNILNMCNSAFPKSSKNILNDLARQPRLAIINFTE